MKDELLLFIVACSFVVASTSGPTFNWQCFIWDLRKIRPSTDCMVDWLISLDICMCAKNQIIILK